MNRVAAVLAHTTVILTLTAAAQTSSPHDTPRPKETWAEAKSQGMLLCIQSLQGTADGGERFVPSPWQLACGTWKVTSVDPETDWLLSAAIGLCREWVMVDCKGRVLLAKPVPGQRFSVTCDCAGANQSKAKVQVLSSMTNKWQDFGSGYGFASIARISDSPSKGTTWRCGTEQYHYYNLWLPDGGLAWVIPRDASMDSKGVNLPWKEQGGVITIVDFPSRVYVGRKAGDTMTMVLHTIGNEAMNFAKSHRDEVWAWSTKVALSESNPVAFWAAGERIQSWPPVTCRQVKTSTAPSEVDYYKATGQDAIKVPVTRQQ